MYLRKSAVVSFYIRAVLQEQASAEGPREIYKWSPVFCVAVTSGDSGEMGSEEYHGEEYDSEEQAREFLQYHGFLPIKAK